MAEETKESELMRWLREHPPGPFKPGSFYSKLGDAIICHWANEDCYAEEVGEAGPGCLSVYRLMTDPTRVVGVKINQVAKLLEGKK